MGSHLRTPRSPYSFTLPGANTPTSQALNHHLRSQRRAHTVERPRVDRPRPGRRGAGKRGVCASALGHSSRWVELGLASGLRHGAGDGEAPSFHICGHAQA
jgi:hypothetical protein